MANNSRVLRPVAGVADAHGKLTAKRTPKMPDHQHRKQMRGRATAALRAFAAAMLGAAAWTAAADYQFIVTPNWDAAEASQAKSSAFASDGTDLEARYRTWLESDGTDLDTTEFVGTILYVR